MSGIRFAFIILLLVSATHGAAPRLDALNPPGWQIGQTNTVTVIGSYTTWPAEMWCSNPEIKFSSEKSKGKFTVTIATNVVPGTYLVRMHSKDGASDAKLFIAGSHPEMSEKENNGSLTDAQVITNLPIVINGILHTGGDTDFFRIRLKRGQTISARLDGYRLRSLIDPFIRLHDPNGYEVALASDTHTIDPFLYYQAKLDGDYALQILAIGHKAATSVSFSGNSSAVYRLTVTTNGATNPGEPFDSQLKEQRKGDQPQIIKAPTTLAGVVGKPGEIDHYQFAAKKGEQFIVRVESHRLGYPMDPVMVINRPGGNLLREVDDTKPYRDPEYLVKTSDGDYTVEVRDRFLRGGKDFRYRLVIEKSEPSVDITFDKEIIALEAGKTNDVKLKIARKNSHNAKMTVVFEDLPKGVSVKNEMIDAKAKEAIIKLTTATNAPAFSGPTRILVRDETTKDPIVRKVTRSFIAADSRGDYLLNETEFFWITVKPAPPPKKEEKKVEKKEPAKKK